MSIFGKKNCEFQAEEKRLAAKELRRPIQYGGLYCGRGGFKSFGYFVPSRIRITPIQGSELFELTNSVF